jgi:hypothetical protein
MLTKEEIIGMETAEFFSQSGRRIKNEKIENCE